MELEIVEDDSVWYAPYAKVLTENKKVPRTITAFDQEITRGEMAEMVWRVMEKRAGVDYYNQIRFGELEINYMQEEVQKQNPEMIKIYLILLNDKGEHGKEAGCGDSTVAVLREIDPNQDPIQSTLEELFSIKGDLSLIKDNEFKLFYEEISGEQLNFGVPSSKDEDKKFLYDSLSKSEIIVDNISTDKNGELKVELKFIDFSLGGACDGPRFVNQIKETVLQFSPNKKIQIYIDDQKLESFSS